MTLGLDTMRPDDWPAVRAIYEAGIATGNATFETAAPDWPAWDAAHLAGHRLVARIDGRVAGWTALAPVSDRCAYAGVAEDSIYVAPEAQGQGVGRALLATVVASAEHAGIWTVQTGIFPENQASIRLHEACGFRVVGLRERLGRLHGRWRTWCCWNAAARPSPEVAKLAGRRAAAASRSSPHRPAERDRGRGRYLESVGRNSASSATSLPLGRAPTIRACSMPR
jgi:phosphinothricin acetyltransferase